MHRFTRRGLVLLALALVVLVATFQEKRETTVIPFSAASGYSGEITLDLPAQVKAGDVNELKARVALSHSSGNLTQVAVVGRIEAGLEELSPQGRVTVSLVGGSSVELVWSFRAADNTNYPGNLWLWLVTDSGEDLLLANEFKVASRAFLGLPVRTVRVGAILILVISLMMVLFGMKKGKRKEVV